MEQIASGENDMSLPSQKLLW